MDVMRMLGVAALCMKFWLCTTSSGVVLCGQMSSLTFLYNYTKKYHNYSQHTLPQPITLQLSWGSLSDAPSQSAPFCAGRARSGIPKMRQSHLQRCRHIFKWRVSARPRGIGQTKLIICFTDPTGWYSGFQGKKLILHGRSEQCHSYG